MSTQLWNQLGGHSHTLFNFSTISRASNAMVADALYDHVSGCVLSHVVEVGNLIKQNHLTEWGSRCSIICDIEGYNRCNVNVSQGCGAFGLD